jgi:catechol 2,3-dioxygenase-like lactoylglutathione lyase family enzyme
MKIHRIDHVQLAMPAAGEEKARAFYCGVLGLAEVPKPPGMANRGGAWFELGPVKIHVGVEQDFRPAKKAHPALVVEGQAEIIAKCEQLGYRVTSDVPFDGYRRVHVEDPFGNRLELMERE